MSIREILARPMRLVALGGILVALAGCDLEVTNPGPVADAFLDDPAAYDAIINAVARNLNYAMNAQGLDVGIRTREIHALDRDDWRGISYVAHIGESRTDGPAYINPWQYGQAARWVGEDALRRFAAALDPEAFSRSASVARGHLWTGYANRMLGEYFCQAVFDGGAALPGEEYFRRAEAVFTAALEIGTAAGAPEVATAARAGRASVRVHLGDWTGAVEDARAVPTDFRFLLPYHANGDWRYYNAFRNSGLPQDGAYTVWNTYYEGYYEAYRDPRTPWQVSEQRPTRRTSLSPWSGTDLPFLVQTKYTAFDSPVVLSDGGEMRLVEAEALLRAGDVEGAMAIVDALRAGVGVAPWPAPASLEEAWTLLKRERGIELWLEGRRLADLRRWSEAGTPGALSPYEMGTTNGGPDLAGRALCLPVPQAEIDQNPNL